MLRIGIAGVGMIAQSYMTQVANGKIHGKVTALNSRNRANMEDALAKTGLTDVALYTDYHEMLESGKIDVVMICTPHYFHPQMAMDALARGIHPLVEKPVGVYSEEVQALAAELKKRPELRLGVLYCNRMKPLYRKVKEMVDAGAVGKLKRADWLITNLYRTAAYHKSSPWRGTYKSEGGGVLMNQASHQLDLYLWMTGLPQTVHAFCYYGMERDIEVENDAMVHMEFAGGATGQFIASSREFPGTNRLELIGDNGQIIVEDDCRLTYTKLDMPESVFSQTSEEIFGKIPCTTIKQEFPIEDAMNYLAEITNDFLGAVETGGQPFCTLEQAMRPLTVTNAAYLSSWQRKSIALPFDAQEFTKELQARF